jgi:hypothetical protein
MDADAHVTPAAFQRSYRTDGLYDSCKHELSQNIKKFTAETQKAQRTPLLLKKKHVTVRMPLADCRLLFMSRDFIEMNLLFFSAPSASLR